MIAFSKETIQIISSIGLLLVAGVHIYKKKFRPLCSVFNSASFKSIELTDQVVVITGANSGIGFEATLMLVERGARVIMACRDTQRARLLADKISKKIKRGSVEVMYLNLSNMDSVKQFASKLNRVDILINNAGVMACPRAVTEDGFEYQFQVNYLGHYLLTRLLLPLLAESPRPRIINVTSKLYETGSIHWDDLSLEKFYDPVESYKQSKLANILFTNELEIKFKSSVELSNLQAYSVSPGIVLTNLGRHTVNKSLMNRVLYTIFYPLLWYFMRTARQGAECIVYCAIQADLKPRSGYYLRNCEFVQLVNNANSERDCNRLWALSESLVSKWL